MYVYSILSFGLFSRWDIIAERLGLMLVFGDLVWIPFTFSIQVCHLEKMNIQNVWSSELSFSLAINLHISTLSVPQFLSILAQGGGGALFVFHLGQVAPEFFLSQSDA